jgi:hypothetical protein
MTVDASLPAVTTVIPHTRTSIRSLYMIHLIGGHSIPNAARTSTNQKSGRIAAPSIFVAIKEYQDRYISLDANQTKLTHHGFSRTGPKVGSKK